MFGRQLSSSAQKSAPDQDGVSSTADASTGYWSPVAASSLDLSSLGESPSAGTSGSSPDTLASLTSLPIPTLDLATLQEELGSQHQIAALDAQAISGSFQFSTNGETSLPKDEAFSAFTFPLPAHSSPMLPPMGYPTVGSSDGGPLSPPLPPRVYKPCVVCNDKSSGYHYGVSSCEGCKGFFRRSVQKNMTYTCHKDGNCVVNKTTRNRCQHCRLQRCFTQGMSKEAVRNDRNKKKKKQEESLTPEPAPPAVIEVSEEEVALLRAVERAHLETFPATTKDTGLTVSDVVKEGSSLLWERVTELSTTGIKKIVEFGKKVPGFRKLNSSDQIMLLKSACLEILILRLGSRYVDASEQIVFSCGLALSCAQLEVGGFGSLTDTIFRFARSLHQMEVDQTELAMLAAVCLVSGDRSGLKHPEAVERLQEPLLEALKHYSRQRRSEQTHCFARMLMKLTDLRSISIKGADKVLHLNFNSKDAISPLLVEMLDRAENVCI